MDDARSAGLSNDQASYRGLRHWIEKVDELGELLRVDMPAGMQKWVASLR